MIDFKLYTEKQLNEIANTKELLDSQGNYGLGCLVHEGNLTINEDWLSDELYYEFSEKFGDDIGTIAILGDLIIDGELRITDRLMCLFIQGNLKATIIETWETEVFVTGNVEYKKIKDEEDLIAILGKKIKIK